MTSDDGIETVFRRVWRSSSSLLKSVEKFLQRFQQRPSWCLKETLNKTPFESSSSKNWHRIILALKAKQRNWRPRRQSCVHRGDPPCLYLSVTWLQNREIRHISFREILPSTKTKDGERKPQQKHFSRCPTSWRTCTHGIRPSPCTRGCPRGVGSFCP